MLTGRQLDSKVLAFRSVGYVIGIMVGKVWDLNGKPIPSTFTTLPELETYEKTNPEAFRLLTSMVELLRLASCRKDDILLRFHRLCEVSWRDGSSGYQDKLPQLFAVLEQLREHGAEYGFSEQQFLALRKALYAATQYVIEDEARFLKFDPAKEKEVERKIFGNDLKLEFIGSFGLTVLANFKLHQEELAQATPKKGNDRKEALARQEAFSKMHKLMSAHDIYKDDAFALAFTKEQQKKQRDAEMALRPQPQPGERRQSTDSPRQATPPKEAMSAASSVLRGATPDSGKRRRVKRVGGRVVNLAEIQDAPQPPLAGSVVQQAASPSPRSPSPSTAVAVANDSVVTNEQDAAMATALELIEKIQPGKNQASDEFIAAVKGLAALFVEHLSSKIIRGDVEGIAGEIYGYFLEVSSKIDIFLDHYVKVKEQYTGDANVMVLRAYLRGAQFIESSADGINLLKNINDLARKSKFAVALLLLSIKTQKFYGDPGVRFLLLCLQEADKRIVIDSWTTQLNKDKLPDTYKGKVVSILKDISSSRPATPPPVVVRQSQRQEKPVVALKSSVLELAPAQAKRMPEQDLEYVKLCLQNLRPESPVESVGALFSKMHVDDSAKRYDWVKNLLQSQGIDPTSHLRVDWRVNPSDKSSAMFVAGILPGLLNDTDPKLRDIGMKLLQQPVVALALEELAPDSVQSYLATAGYQVTKNLRDQLAGFDQSIALNYGKNGSACESLSNGIAIANSRFFGQCLRATEFALGELEGYLSSKVTGVTQQDVKNLFAKSLTGSQVLSLIRALAARRIEFDVRDRDIEQYCHERLWLALKDPHLFADVTAKCPAQDRDIIIKMLCREISMGRAVGTHVIDWLCRNANAKAIGDFVVVGYEAVKDYPALQSSFASKALLCACLFTITLEAARKREFEMVLNAVVASVPETAALARLVELRNAVLQSVGADPLNPVEQKRYNLVMQFIDTLAIDRIDVTLEEDCNHFLMVFSGGKIEKLMELFDSLDRARSDKLSNFISYLATKINDPAYGLLVTEFFLQPKVCEYVRQVPINAVIKARIVGHYIDVFRSFVKCSTKVAGNDIPSIAIDSTGVIKSGTEDAICIAYAKLVENCGADSFLTTLIVSKPPQDVLIKARICRQHITKNSVLRDEDTRWLSNAGTCRSDDRVATINKLTKQGIFTRGDYRFILGRDDVALLLPRALASGDAASINTLLQDNWQHACSVLRDERRRETFSFTQLTNLVLHMPPAGFVAAVADQVLATSTARQNFVTAFVSLIDDVSGSRADKAALFVQFCASMSNVAIKKQLLKEMHVATKGDQVKQDAVAVRQRELLCATTPLGKLAGFGALLARAGVFLGNNLFAPKLSYNPQAIVEAAGEPVVRRVASAAVSEAPPPVRPAQQDAASVRSSEMEELPRRAVVGARS